MDGPRKIPTIGSVSQVQRIQSVTRSDQRASSAKRGYDRTWRRLREAHLSREPLCRRCKRGAVHVDHIKPIAKGGLRLDPANLQSLCHSCHSRKTASEDMNRG